jgi:uncharacterized protein
MIAYIDTSTFVKLIIEEEGSDAAEVLWDEADNLLTSMLLHVEARAALAAAQRAGRLTDPQFREATQVLASLWLQFEIVEIEALVLAAGGLAERHGLRGYDAMHLASALRVGADVFSTADRRLAAAAESEGMHISDPQTGTAVLPA